MQHAVASSFLSHDVLIISKLDKFVKRTKMRKISQIFRDDPRYRRLQKPLEAARICDEARRVSRGRFEVISYRGGLLSLGVKSPGQAANLSAESEKIIIELNQKIGSDAVKRLRFKIS